MGVIFQSGMAIGAVPGFASYGVTRGWLLATDSFGCQPAWDNGVMTLLGASTGCTGTADFFSVLNGGDPDFSFYISGIDSTNTDQSTFLSQAIGQAGTMTFTQGATSVTIGFDETTFGANQYSTTDGLYYDNGPGTTPPYIVTGSGTFYGFNNAGHGTNSSGGSGEQYYVQPSNAQILTISINVGPTPTPTPTATSTPTPTPTPTSTGSYYYLTNGYSCGVSCTYVSQFNVISPTPLTMGYFYNNPENRSYTFEILSSISPISGAYDLTGEPGYIICTDACNTPVPTPTPTATSTPTSTTTPTPTPTPFTYSIGDSYGGGILAYILQSGDPGYVPGVTHGLIVSTADQGDGSVTWSNGSNVDVGILGTAIGDGLSNTNAIITAQGAGSYAASLARNATDGGYSDWYLPSNGELQKLYDNVGPGASSPNTNIANFNLTNQYGRYWSSSSVYGDTYNSLAHDLIFALNILDNNSRSYAWNVRAIRSF
jgi:hypothetical protein